MPKRRARILECVGNHQGREVLRPAAGEHAIVEQVQRQRGKEVVDCGHARVGHPEGIGDEDAEIVEERLARMCTCMGMHTDTERCMHRHTLILTKRHSTRR